MPPAARLSDLTTHGTPLAPGPGSANVLIGFLPAWRAMTDQHACPMVSVTGPDGVGNVIMGSPTVFINGMMACRMGDIVLEKPGLALGPANPIVLGCMTVMIGEVGMGAVIAPSVGGGMSALGGAMGGETGTTAKALAKASESGSATVVVGGNKTLSQAAGGGSPAGAPSGGSSGAAGGRSPSSAVAGGSSSAAGSSAAGSISGGSSAAQAGTPPGSTPAGADGSAAPDQKTWIEIELVDSDGNPVPNEPYSIHLPDGTDQAGCTDSQGMARLDGIDPGNCSITFTALDKQAWSKA